MLDPPIKFIVGVNFVSPRRDFQIWFVFAQFTHIRLFGFDNHSWHRSIERHTVLGY